MVLDEMTQCTRLILDRRMNVMIRLRFVTAKEFATEHVSSGLGDRVGMRNLCIAQYVRLSMLLHQLIV